MSKTLQYILEQQPVEASAPCRIDMAGTLDLATFFYPLQYLGPCTSNIAIDSRTRVRLFPYRRGWIKVSSRGFESAEFLSGQAPFAHRLGLMFAIAAFFRAEGIHIMIDSASPPRSALGGSSSAGVALIAAFLKLIEPEEDCAIPRRRIALLAHALEQSVAAVPCGMQDQLAAAYGGVHVWHWQVKEQEACFSRKPLVEKKDYNYLEDRLLLAYCGVPHESCDINGRWVRQFLAGRHRDEWFEICKCARKFATALADKNLASACMAMNREVEIRRGLTPDVLDSVGEKLVRTAVDGGCGARFTGAGGGGCIWALGNAGDIEKLREKWKEVLACREGAGLLNAVIDGVGVSVRQ
ncbi:MAG: galactokinase [Desulfobacteraceae bacterium 4572_123]|nr:MAG: galactokinase [Desulfobacteraceae bacterium 4572_123]